MCPFSFARPNPSPLSPPSSPASLATAIRRRRRASAQSPAHVASPTPPRSAPALNRLPPPSQPLPDACPHPPPPLSAAPLPAALRRPSMPRVSLPVAPRSSCALPRPVRAPATSPPVGRHDGALRWRTAAAPCCQSKPTGEQRPATRGAGRLPGLLVGPDPSVNGPAIWRTPWLGVARRAT
jgi:hypothetical protein